MVHMTTWHLYIVKVTEDHGVLKYTLRSEGGVLAKRRNILVVPRCRFTNSSFTVTSTKLDDPEVLYLEMELRTGATSLLQSRGPYVKVYDPSADMCSLIKRPITERYELQWEDVINQSS